MISHSKAIFAVVIGLALGLAGCDSGDKKSSEAKAPADASAPSTSVPAAAPVAEKMAEAAPPAAVPAPEAAPEAKPAEPAAAPAAEKVAEAAPPPAAAPAPEAAPEAKPAEPAPAEPASIPAAPAGASLGGGVKGDDGKYMLPSGEPTFNIAADGTVDWYTYSGYKRFHSECHVCHGPGAGGSSFAPALSDSLKTMDYQTFVTTVMSGRITDKGGTKFIMPALGDNKNVACFIDDLYAYIRARAVGDLPFGRPEKREDKPQAAKDYEKSCFGD